MAYGAFCRTLVNIFEADAGIYNLCNGICTIYEWQSGSQQEALRGLVGHVHDALA